MPEQTRQLPGVKGQWILCSECPPIIFDEDNCGHVEVYITSNPLRPFKYDLPYNVLPIEYWRPVTYLDPRPFKLEPATTQPATTERRIVQLMRHNELVHEPDWDKIARDQIRQRNTNPPPREP